MINTKFNFKQLDFQQKAIDFALDYLIVQNKNEFNLQAPTGAGKTYILGSIIDNLFKNNYLNQNNLTFVFISPSQGKIDYQNYEKISTYLENNLFNGFSTSYIGTNKNKKLDLQYINYFEPNTVYFLGWQMFSSGTTLTNINTENNNIFRIINNTKNKKQKIILIIDEAHREYEKRKENDTVKNQVIKQLDPFKIIRVSATLKENDIKVDYEISYEDVIAEFAIKPRVLLNNVDDKKLVNCNLDNLEDLINIAIKKQQTIKSEYKKRNIHKLPLMLVQIPNDEKILQLDKNHLRNKLKKIFEKYGYSEKYNLAFWLNNYKTINDIKEITKNDSSIEILIFKIAVATGWDVPWANMLVRLRDSNVKSFNIQTLGRILRNSFFKIYNNPLIDYAYVYTNDKKYENIIKKESPLVIDGKIENVPRIDCPYVKQSEFSINKLVYQENKNFDYDLICEKIANQLFENPDFVDKFMNLNDIVIQPIYTNVSIDSKNIIEFDTYEFCDDLKNGKKERQSQINFNFKTLFQYYIDYLLIISKHKKCKKIFINIQNNMQKINRSIKDFYIAMIYNSSKSLFDNNTYTIFEKIDLLFNSQIQKNLKLCCEKYDLPSDYKCNTKYFKKCKNHFTFGMLPNKDEKIWSTFETQFCDDILRNFKNDDEIHVFKNGTNIYDKNQDFYIEYFDPDSFKKCKFFPDYILINEKLKTAFIIEVKGRNEKNIDKNTEPKMLTLNENLNKINKNSKYKLIAGYCATYNKDLLEFSKLSKKNDKKEYGIEKLIEIIKMNNKTISNDQN